MITYMAKSEVGSQEVTSSYGLSIGHNKLLHYMVWPWREGGRYSELSTRQEMQNDGSSDF
jgi:hypothetical protein